MNWNRKWGRSDSRRSSVCLGILSIALAGPGCGSLSAQVLEDAATPDNRLDPLRRQVQRFVDEGEIIGAELLIQKEGVVLMHEAFGWSSLEQQRPMRTGTIFGIKSMTKPLTGTAIQILVDEGTIDLQTRVSSLLDSWDRDDKRTITIEQLLTHRSGLPMSLENSDEILDSLESVLEVAEQAAELPLSFEPGSEFSYSDVGTDTLAGVIEKITGLPVDEFLRVRVFAPLDMHDTFMGALPGAFESRDIPTLYRRNEEQQWKPIWDYMDREATFYLYPMGSQSAYCTTTDYAKFLGEWCRAGRNIQGDIVSPDVFRRATQSTGVRRSTLNAPGHLWSYGQLMQMSYYRPVLIGGEDTLESLGRDVLGARPVTIGHYGHDGTYAWAWPEEDLIVLYFTQSSQTLTCQFIQSTVDKLLVHPANAVQIAPAELNRFTGRYAIKWDGTNEVIITIESKEGQLELSWPDATLIMLEQPDRRGYWHLAGDIEKDISYRAIAFDEEDGRITGLRWYQSSYVVRAPRFK